MGLPGIGFNRGDRFRNKRCVKHVFLQVVRSEARTRPWPGMRLPSTRTLRRHPGSRRCTPWARRSACSGSWGWSGCTEVLTERSAENLDIVRDDHSAITEETGLFDALQVRQVVVLPVIDEHQIKLSPKLPDTLGRRRDSNVHHRIKPSLSDDATGHSRVARVEPLDSRGCRQPPPAPRR